jgi:uncharacterized DUF497 family protein
MDFEWDDGNIGHCERHGLSTGEIEWVIERGLIEFDRDHSGVEQRFKAIGPIPAGRFAVVAFTYREGRVRPVTGRRMHDKEVAKWLKNYRT